MPDGEERIGTRLGAYRIERLIGRGGMGMVFLAEHVHLGRMVALKILPPDLARDESFRKRFVRESRLAAGIEHPNVIPVYDAGESEGELFIAMKYVEGTDLRALLQQRGRLDPEHTLALLEPVGAALDAAHREGLVHRDVKPGNILIAATDHVYLSDFGLTKRTSADTSVTATGYFVGTMSYAPPEQIQSHDLDGRADQYSLACVAFECLTGRVPFVRDTDVALLYAHLQEPPPMASEYGPELPPGVDEVLARGMAKPVDDRYASCSTLVEALRGAIRGTALPPPEAPTVEPATTGRIRATSPPQASTTVRGPTVRTGEPTLPSPERPSPAPPARERRRRRGVWLFVVLGTALIGALAAFLVLGPLSQPEEEGQMLPSDDGDGGNGQEDQIVFLRPGQGSQLDVWVMAADGSERRPLHADIASGTTPSWSPDRRHIVLDGEGDGDAEIYRLRAQPGGRVKQLTDNTFADAAPAWSPDGSTIAFESDEGGDFDVWVMNADGTGREILFEADGNQTRPAWSPDGSQLVFQDDRSGNPDIWVVDAAGTSPEPLLAEEGDDGAPAWSPDGNSIAFRSTRDGNLEIYVMAGDGTDVRRLTETEAEERAPTWSPDGSKILFHRHTGDMDIWMMDPDGSNQEPITRTPGDEFGASF